MELPSKIKENGNGLRFRFLLLVFLFVVNLPIHAEEMNPDTTWSATLWIAPGMCKRDPWVYGSSYMTVDAYPKLSYAFPQQHINLIPMLLGLPRGWKNELTEFSYSIRILAPDGTFYFQAQDIPMPLASLAEAKLPIIPSQHVQLFFKNGDPLGVYTLRTEFKLKGKILMTVESSLELRSFSFRGDFNGEVDFENWIHHYYMQPEPDRAASSYLYLAPFNFRTVEIAELFKLHALSVFYMTIFENNLWIFDYINGRYAHASQPLKERILFANARFLKVPPESPGTMSAELLTFWKWSTKYEYIPLEPLSAGIQLDILWATFFATGRYEPILKILSTLENKKYVEHLDNKEEISNEEKQLAVLYQVAYWSLQKNIPKYVLLRAYCNHTLEREKLSASASETLRKLLRSSGHLLTE